MLYLSGTPNSWHSINKFGAEKNIGVVEHAVFEGYNNKLRTFEMAFQHLANVLSMWQI